MTKSLHNNLRFKSSLHRRLSSCLIRVNHLFVLKGEGICQGWWEECANSPVMWSFSEENLQLTSGHSVRANYLKTKSGGIFHVYSSLCWQSTQGTRSPRTARSFCAGGRICYHKGNYRPQNW